MRISVPEEPIFKRHDDERARPIVVVLAKFSLSFKFFNLSFNDTEYVRSVVFISDAVLELLKSLTVVEEDLDVFLNYSIFMV